VKKWAAFGLLIAVALLVLRLAGDAAYWKRYAGALRNADIAQQARAIQPRWRIEGAGSAVPRATADAEFIAVEALDAATAYAKAQGSKALIVQRHGHRVHDFFADGVSGATQVVGGELAPALMALALASSVERRKLTADEALQLLQKATATTQRPMPRNPWSVAAREYFSLPPAPQFLLEDTDGDLAQLLSQRVWMPLQAADAWAWGKNNAAVRVDCCVVAQLEDWLRLGELLADQGSYLGTRIIAADWMRSLLASDAAGRWHPAWLNKQRDWVGAEPPAAREVQWFDLGADVRLWLVPRRKLAVLHWSEGGNAQDTELLNLILRGLTDQLPSAVGEANLSELVPGH
jgi:hypothetical protein